jgi:hypothetical protein
VLINYWLRMFERSFWLSYIDAGTGSLIIQVVIGSAAGIILAVKMSWKKIMNWLIHSPSVKEKLVESRENTVEQ